MRAPSGNPGTHHRHVPQRMCVSCRTSSAKRTLVRIVRTADGQVEVDPTGKRSGRGAYLCTNQPCWELALQRGHLGRGLRTTVSPDDAERIRGYASRLPENDPE